MINVMPNCAGETQAFMPRRPINRMRYPISTAKTAKKVYVSNLWSKSFLDEVHVWRGFEAVSSKYANGSKLWSPIFWGPGWSQRRRGGFAGIAGSRGFTRLKRTSCVVWPMRAAQLHIPPHIRIVPVINMMGA